MTDDTFDYILRHVKLPMGKLLSDGRTYRVTKHCFGRLDEESRKALRMFNKFLVVTDGEGHVAGGVLFYGSFDIQAWMLCEYRGLGYMSMIHRNGILKGELYPGQQVSISEFGIESADDFNMKVHMLSLIGLKARNENALRDEVIPLFENGTIRSIQLFDLRRACV